MPAPRHCCGSRYFFEDAELAKHLRSPKHATGIPCTVCGAGFESQSKLNDHHNDGFHLRPPLPRAIPQVPINPRSDQRTPIPQGQRNNTSKRFPKFYCMPCAREFGDQKAMDTHLLNSALHNPQFRCVPCNREFTDQNALDSHHVDSPFHNVLRCQTCGVNFADRFSLTQHERFAHQGTTQASNWQPVHQTPARQLPVPQGPARRPSPHRAPRYYCTPCSREFSDQNSLDCHLVDSPAHNSRFNCTPCNREFADQSLLDAHLIASPLHNTFRCNTCGANCATKASLHEHLATHRGAPAPGQSQQPSNFQGPARQTPNSRGAAQGSSSTQGSRFYCKRCNMQLHDQPDLDNHNRSHAHLQRALVCHKCQIDFNSQKTLDQHLVIMHPPNAPRPTPSTKPGTHAPARPNPPPGPLVRAPARHNNPTSGPVVRTPAARNNQTPRPVIRAPQFTCATCNRTFANPYALDQHLVSAGHPGHVRTAPAPVFTCEECPRTFEAKDLLTLHAAEHVQKRLRQ